MSYYRLWLLDREGHVLHMRERHCDRGKLAVIATDILNAAEPYIVAVEVWDGTGRIDRIERG